MNPAWSVVFFTAIAGAAQGLVVALSVALLAGTTVSEAFVQDSLAIAFVMSVAGLLSSFGHLGRKERAWRAVLMWRTSWLSRECLVLPAFIGWLALWWLALRAGVYGAWLPLVAIVLAAGLWLCTAMIYACLRFIQEWAQPLTLVNFTMIGLSSGCILASALATAHGEAQFMPAGGAFALVLTIVALATRIAALHRNAHIKHRSTLQSATGIRSVPLVQKAMGMSAGAFNTREFFHGRTLALLKNVKLVLIVFGFVLPALLVIAALLNPPLPVVWWLAVASQAIGLLADRWFFFAQARHPQNLYYQVVS